MLDSNELIVVGTGFASTFFLQTYLARAKPNARVLVLERGRRDLHAWQVANRRSSSYPHETYINATPSKPWAATIGFGGGSNCWWGCTPRMLPNDFRVHSLYGVGRDWPLSYAELAPYYDQVETVMSMAGPSVSPFPRTRPYPQSAHALSLPDKLLQQAYPEHVFAMPTARASAATPRRPGCCASSTCFRCPIGAKFTIQNELSDVYEDPRVQLKLSCTAREVITRGGQAVGVLYEEGERGEEREARADLVVLGANAIGNAELLLRSAIEQGPVGQGLNEQIGIMAQVYLKGVEGLQGGTSLTAHSYNLYDGPHRAERAACLIEHQNTPQLRAEFGRWKELFSLKLLYEDLPQPHNRVSVAPGSRDLPVLTYRGPSEYARRSMARAEDDLTAFLAPLPVEEIVMGAVVPTESHILGTAPMGHDPATSVVDSHLVHHFIRNLLVLGSSSFPSSAPANPTLTLSALSIRAADWLTRSGAPSGEPQ